MVGDVSPDIHFKNFRATTSRSLTHRHTDRHWPRLGNNDGRQDQALDPSGSGDCTRCNWRASRGALAGKDYAGQINRPESEWGSRARLRSIRGDSGYTLDTDIY